jgi:hypothetical protein
MNALPLAAELVPVIHQHVFYPRDLAARESVVFPKFDRPRPTVQIEHSLTAATDHVHMGWPMIVRVDSHPHSAKPEERRQHFIVSDSQVLGFFGKPSIDPRIGGTVKFRDYSAVRVSRDGYAVARESAVENTRLFSFHRRV